MSPSRPLALAFAVAGLALLSPVQAADMGKASPDPMASFHGGTVIPAFGKVASVTDADMRIPAGTEFHIAFDVATAKEATLNRTLESAARFLNMQVEAGVPAERIHLAIVVHGPATFDVAGAEAYERKYPGAENLNAALVDALIKAGVRIIVCGQSAAGQGVKKTDLLPGVELALSAMTAHALLQQQGYTLNPF